MERRGMKVNGIFKLATFWVDKVKYARLRKILLGEDISFAQWIRKQIDNKLKEVENGG